MTEKELMLTTILECERQDLYTRPVELSSKQKNRLNEMQTRFSDGEPLQYVLGEAYFLNARLKVNEHVLIPRPETEILVDYIQKDIQSKDLKNVKALDLGTGSGNIPISLAQFQSDIKVVAVDVCENALLVAQDNARFNQVEHQIEFIHSDMCCFLQDQSNESKFDYLISNPPYIKRNDLATLSSDVQQEPQLALNGGDDGLDFYRVILSEGDKFLKQGGLLVLELGDGQMDDIQELASENFHFEFIKSLQDYCDVERVAIFQRK